MGTASGGRLLLGESAGSLQVFARNELTCDQTLLYEKVMNDGILPLCLEINQFTLQAKLCELFTIYNTMPKSWTIPVIDTDRSSVRTSTAHSQTRNTQSIIAPIEVNPIDKL